MVFKRKFQEGGPMPAEATAQGGAPVEQGANDPMALLLQGAAQAVQTGDCNIALQVCQMLIQLAGGGNQPAPTEEAPQQAEGEPRFKFGGKIAYRV